MDGKGIMTTLTCELTKDHAGGILRVIRGVIGGFVLLAWLFNFGGLAERVAMSPTLTALALAAVSQLIQYKDIVNAGRVYAGGNAPPSESTEDTDATDK